MFKQVSNSSETTVIGVRNGIYQIEIDENELKKKKDYPLIEEFFLKAQLSDSSGYNHKVANLKLSTLKGHLLKGAKITDLMGFTPYFFGCPFVVSNEFVNCLLDCRVASTEYRLFNLKLKGVQQDFYLIWLPMIGLKEVNFLQSKIYRSKDMLNPNKEYVEIGSVEDFEDYRAKKRDLTSFEKISLPPTYSSRDIIFVQGIGNLFFSSRLIKTILSHDISGFTIPKLQVELTFDYSLVKDKNHKIT